MSQTMTLSRIHFPVTTLGPGRRIGIWFQGCSIRCPGCISSDTWAHGVGQTTVSDVIEVASAYFNQADGITISGGEPFEQPDALQQLLTALRKHLGFGVDILVYSGFTYPVIAKALQNMEGLIDAIISEPFELERSQTRPLMGSDNQHLHTLTNLGRDRFADFRRCRDHRDDNLDLMADENGDVWLAGIPKRGDLNRLRTLLSAKGITIKTSEHIPK